MVTGYKYMYVYIIIHIQLYLFTIYIGVHVHILTKHSGCSNLLNTHAVCYNCWLVIRLCM